MEIGRFRRLSSGTSARSYATTVNSTPNVLANEMEEAGTWVAPMVRSMLSPGYGSSVKMGSAGCAGQQSGKWSFRSCRAVAADQQVQVQADEC